MYSQYAQYSKRQRVVLTRRLEGKEICVTNGTDELPKEQIEEILQQHSAKIVQNPMRNTFCVIVGNNRTIRALEVINSKKYDVVTLDWFQRVTNQSDSDWASSDNFLPWELLCSRDSTRQKLAENYDEYYDHFSVYATEESLKRSLAKMTNELADNQLTSEQEKEMDKELFGGPSPYSLFRDIIGFFGNRSYHANYKFRFMSEDTSDETCTIVRNINAREQTSIKIVKCKWIEECFQNGRICDITDYLID
ncbi:DNA ligase 4-like [Temnothorax nylanderi]|uniref:DNA ligase 4-like n=1 Tax=Temnothorax nylanderi TaxID=102681 RepID=UPI003A87C055